MNDQTLLAIGAVALGWFLNELAGAFRLAREERQLVRSSVPPLLRLYFEQFRINEILHFFNEQLGEDFERAHKEITSQAVEDNSFGEFIRVRLSQHETQRKENITLPKASQEFLVKDLDLATLALGRVAPIEAYKAKKLLAEFLLFQDTELPEYESVPKAYLNQWSVVLNVYRADIASLRKLVLTVSIRAGILHFIKVWCLLKSEEAELSGGPSKAKAAIDGRA